MQANCCTIKAGGKLGACLIHVFQNCYLFSKTKKTQRTRTVFKDDKAQGLNSVACGSNRRTETETLVMEYVSMDHSHHTNCI